MAFYRTGFDPRAAVWRAAAAPAVGTRPRQLPKDAGRPLDPTVAAGVVAACIPDRTGAVEPPPPTAGHQDVAADERQRTQDRRPRTERAVQTRQPALQYPADDGEVAGR